jgi:hypothetical protein
VFINTTVALLVQYILDNDVQLMNLTILTYIELEHAYIIHHGMTRYGQKVWLKQIRIGPKLSNGYQIFGGASCFVV